jgi:trigger factor
VENYEVEIGSKSMIPGFEDQLIGLQAGDAKTFDIVFPEPYGNPKLAGQSAQFEIEVAKVEEALLPEIDEEFIKAYGVEDGLRASFDEQLKNHMEKELARALKTKLKDSVLNQLNDSFTFDIPKALIDEQIEVLKQNYLQEVKQRNIGADALDIPASQFEDSARNRVKLALIMGEVIRQNEIQLEQDRVKEFVSQIASSYENPQEVVSWYLSDKERLNDIKQLILEEQAIDWIVDHADVSDETLSFQSVMQTASN